MLCGDYEQRLEADWATIPAAQLDPHGDQGVVTPFCPVNGQSDLPSFAMPATAPMSEPPVNREGLIEC